MEAEAQSAVFFSAVPARGAAPPAVGGGADPYVGRVAAAVHRGAKASAVFNSAVPARSAAPPAVGGGAECVLAA